MNIMPKKRTAVCDFCGSTYKMRETKYLMTKVFVCSKCKDKERKDRSKT